MKDIFTLLDTVNDSNSEALIGDSINLTYDNLDIKDKLKNILVDYNMTKKLKKALYELIVQLNEVNTNIENNLNDLENKDIDDIYYKMEILRQKRIEEKYYNIKDNDSFLDDIDNFLKV